MLKKCFRLRVRTIQITSRGRPENASSIKSTILRPLQTHGVRSFSSPRTKFHAVKRVERKGQKRGDTLFEQFVGFFKSFAPFGFSSPNTCGVRKTPVSRYGACPGHTGQGSPAALSHTVITKSISGAPAASKLVSGLGTQILRVVPPAEQKL